MEKKRWRQVLIGAFALVISLLGLTRVRERDAEVEVELQISMLDHCEQPGAVAGHESLDRGLL